MYDKDKDKKKDQKKDSMHKNIDKNNQNYENYGKSKDMKKEKK